MNIFIARQPVFNRKKKIFGYELLHRTTEENIFPEIDGDKATSRLLINTFLNIGLDKMVSSKWALINFTQQHLLDRTALNLPPEKVIVEILEHVVPTPEIIAVCKELSDRGYVLALDDFVFDRGLEPLVELADIIKIDFRSLSLEEIEQKKGRLTRGNIKLLAEKVETYAEFEAAWEMGFTYFQGFYFCQPEMLEDKEIPALKVNQLTLLIEVNRKNFSLDKIEKLIAPDVGMSYKLLRYINSAYYYLLNEVTSIRHALVYLGESGIRQFVSLVAISELAADKPDELLRESIIRARLCELLAGCSRQNHDASEMFLLGLFSLLHAMLDTTMISVMERLPISRHIKDALIENSGPFAPFLDIVISYEKGDWKTCQQLLDKVNVLPKEILNAYVEAVGWAETLTEEKTS